MEKSPGWTGPSWDAWLHFDALPTHTGWPVFPFNEDPHPQTPIRKLIPTSSILQPTRLSTSRLPPTFTPPPPSPPLPLPHPGLIFSTLRRCSVYLHELDKTRGAPVHKLTEHILTWFRPKHHGNAGTESQLSALCGKSFLVSFLPPSRHRLLRSISALPAGAAACALIAKPFLALPLKWTWSRFTLVRLPAATKRLFVLLIRPLSDRHEHR